MFCKLPNYSLVILCASDVKVDFRILMALRGSLTYVGPALNAKLRWAGLRAVPLTPSDANHTTILQKRTRSAIWRGDFPTANSECEYRGEPQLTPALPSWFSAVSIAKSKSSIKRAQIFFLYIFQNHRGITLSLDALCFEKWKFVKPRLHSEMWPVYLHSSHIRDACSCFPPGRPCQRNSTAGD